MRLRPLFFSILLLAGYSAQAQISHGGKPVAFESPARTAGLDFITVEPANLEAQKAEDAINDQYKDIPYRFGANMAVDLSMADGEWYTAENGDRVWLMGIASPGATSINFNFSKYEMPAGARLFVYDADRTHYIGSFTHENMQEHGGLSMSLIQSDHIILEYSQPADVSGEPQLEIDRVTHGYRSILHRFDEVQRGPFGNSGSCNINVACPESLGWEDQIRSVAIIIVGGNAHCTGSLVNNTAEDGTPYFLTANHCLNGSISDWVFYFNHESPTCNGNTGPTNQSVSGAQLRASNAGSDVALLELNEAPPESYDVFFNGWDRTGNTPSGATCIHHPAGDIKKITHEHDSPYQATNAGAQTWHIDNWEEGTTEGGSSGSPLFDTEGRVIGQLYGGTASCANTSGYDYYGRFDVSWDGTSASSRLRDWLDPSGTNATILDGTNGFEPTLPNDAALLGVGGIDGIYCSETNVEPQVSLRNSGIDLLTSATITMTINGNPAGSILWTGALFSGETEIVQLPSVSVVDGENVLTIVVSEPNGEVDGNLDNNTTTFTFTAFIEAVEYNITLVLDDYGSETTWEVVDENDNIIHSGGPFTADGGGGGWGSDGTEGQVESADLCLGEGCYTLIVYDEYGDGFCCQYGDGSYTLYDDEGNELTSGGDFGESESFDFCVTIVGVEENELQRQFTLFPNPATSEVVLDLGNTTGEVSLIATDLAGRTVYSTTLNEAAERHTLSVSDWAPGMYLMRVQQNGASAVKRLVISK